ncbi:MAG: IS110 family transposase [Pseudomonadota bacterium]
MRPRTRPVRESGRTRHSLMLHRARGQLFRQRIMTACAIRSHLAEFGIIVAKGIHYVERLLEAAGQAPAAARPAPELLADQLRDLHARLETVTGRIEAAQRSDPLARRLATIPGLSRVAPSAFAVTTPDTAAFRSGRDFSALLGLTPRPHSSGVKERLGKISKAGNRYLRRLLYLGAMAQIAARRRGKPGSDWLWGRLQRKPAKVVAVALANRMARVVWALVRNGKS